MLDPVREVEIRVLWSSSSSRPRIADLIRALVVVSLPKSLESPDCSRWCLVSSRKLVVDAVVVGVVVVGVVVVGVVVGVEDQSRLKKLNRRTTSWPLYLVCEEDEEPIRAPPDLAPLPLPGDLSRCHRCH
ncbi:hypothetical protein Droror1_Dr00003690 [Drosera rotundifolia]